MFSPNNFWSVNSWSITLSLYWLVQKSPMSPVEVASLSHYLQGLSIPGTVAGIPFFTNMVSCYKSQLIASKPGFLNHQQDCIPSREPVGNHQTHRVLLGKSAFKRSCFCVKKGSFFVEHGRSQGPISSRCPTSECPQTLGRLLNPECLVWIHRCGVGWPFWMGKRMDVYISSDRIGQNDACQYGSLMWGFQTSPKESDFEDSVCFCMYTLQGTNISPKNCILKMIFLFPRWDMLIPWKVYLSACDLSASWFAKGWKSINPWWPSDPTSTLIMYPPFSSKINMSPPKGTIS